MFRSEREDYYKSGYMAHLEEDYQGWRKKQEAAQNALQMQTADMKAELDVIDLTVIKNALNLLITSYKRTRDNSWRSWRLFSDKTRDQHIKNLQIRIANLQGSNIGEFLVRLNTELNYADRKNGMNYAATLVDMKNFLNVSISQTIKAKINDYDTKKAILTSKIAYYDREARRVIAKQNGTEDSFIAKNYRNY